MASWITSQGPYSENRPRPLPFNPALVTTVCFSANFTVFMHTVSMFVFVDFEAQFRFLVKCSPGQMTFSWVELTIFELLHRTPNFWDWDFLVWLYNFGFCIFISNMECLKKLFVTKLIQQTTRFIEGGSNGYQNVYDMALTTFTLAVSYIVRPFNVEVKLRWCSVISSPHSVKQFDICLLSIFQLHVDSWFAVGWIKAMFVFASWIS